MNVLGRLWQAFTVFDDFIERVFFPEARAAREISQLESDRDAYTVSEKDTEGFDPVRLSPEKKDKQLRYALEILEYVPQTHRLLKRARRDGISFAFYEDHAGTGVSASFSFEDKAIYINPLLLANDMPRSLAHELRHYQQYRDQKWTKTFIASCIEASPRLSVIVDRIMEADAYSFEEIMGDMIDVARQRRRQGMSAATSRKLFRAAARETAEADRKERRAVFGMALLGLDEYDADTVQHHVEQYVQKRGFRAAETEDVRRRTSLSKLREMFNMGVDAGARNYMAEVSDKKLLKAILMPIKPETRRAIWAAENFHRASRKGQVSAKTKRRHQENIVRAFTRMQDAIYGPKQ